MSRSGKFVPGGSGKQTGGINKGTGNRTGPIRAPAEPLGPDAPTGPAGPAKRAFGKGSSLTKPVSKGQHRPIVIMSVLVFFMLFVAGYYFYYLPEVKQVALAQQQEQEMQKERDDAIAAQEKEKEDMAKIALAALATVTVDSKPSGVAVTIGDSHKVTPASFTDLVPGKISVLIQADGYEDYKQDLTVAATKPTDLGTIELVAKVGNLSLTSPQDDVSYSLTGPGDYSHEGQVPDKLEALPAGDYMLTVNQHDWKLPTIPFTIHDKENVQQEIKFPYATLSVTTVPPGATVRKGRVVLGQTPLTLTQLRPGEIDLSVDLAPYTVQWLNVQLSDFDNVTKNIVLQQDKDFIAACGLPMVWIPDGGLWVGKYEMYQKAFETVAGYNPSTFNRPTRPVESISWEAAMAFCEKLNQYEQRAGKLPDGFHYTLPTESQWDLFSANADINLAPMSRVDTLASTQNVGASEPNKYGLYDTLGNVWEWCLDSFDDKGDHTLRGGSWLSSPEDFPGPETRNAGAPKYSDRFTGFRVVLVPN
jgi:formylglycine-generating enzyme required for sulfatase activity